MQPTSPTQRHRRAGQSPDHGSHQRQYVPSPRLAIDVYLETITPEGKADNFAQIIETVLNIRILLAFLCMVLAQVQNITNVSTATNLFDQKFCLDRPTAKRGRIVSDLKDSLSHV